MAGAGDGESKRAVGEGGGTIGVSDRIGFGVADGRAVRVPVGFGLVDGLGVGDHIGFGVADGRAVRVAVGFGVTDGDAVGESVGAAVCDGEGIAVLVGPAISLDRVAQAIRESIRPVKSTAFLIAAFAFYARRIAFSLQAALRMWAQ